MSISLISQVWPINMQTGCKFVLVSLCDTANDDGECFMCVSTIAFKCGMSVRAVQGHLACLEKNGVIFREERTGRSSIYSVNLAVLNAIPRHPLWLQREKLRTPADSAPPPADSAPITVTIPLPIKKTNAGAHAHEPTDSAPPPDSPRFEIFPEIEDRQLVESWMVNCRTKKVPISENLCNRIRDEAKQARMSLYQALGICKKEGWAGFKNSWLANLRSTPQHQPMHASHQAFAVDTPPSQAQRNRIRARLHELQKYKTSLNIC